MSQYRSEHSSSGKYNAYNSLGCYYGQNSTMAPSAPPLNSMVVPNWGSIGYDTLNRGGVGNFKSYFNINDAYGPACNTTYSDRACSSCDRK